MDVRTELPRYPTSCQEACPIGADIANYVGLITVGRFLEALEVIRQDNPFPGVCGRVCDHECEESCRRAETGEAVSIKRLKRFVADYGRRQGERPPELLPPTKKERIAEPVRPCAATARAAPPKATPVALRIAVSVRAAATEAVTRRSIA